MVLVLASLSCGDDYEDRFEYQRNLGHRVFLDGRLEVLIEPGALPLEILGSSQEAAEEGPSIRLFLHASGPTATIRLDHWGDQWLSVGLEVENTFSRAQFSPVMSLLSGLGACEGRDASLGPVVLAPMNSQLVDRGEDAERRWVHDLGEVRLAPCSRLTIRVFAPGVLGRRFGVPLRVAIVGELRGNESTLNAMLDDLEAAPVDLIVSLGNHGQSSEWLSLVAVKSLLGRLGIPLVALMGSNEARGGSPLPFHELFGRSDFWFAVGNVQFLIMDTALSGLSEAQFAYWEDVLERDFDGLRVAFMNVPFFDPSGTRDQGFMSRHQANRLIAMLGRGGVDAIFTAGIGSYAFRRYGGIPVYSTGGGGGRLEGLDEIGHHYLRLEIAPQISSYDPRLESWQTRDVVSVRRCIIDVTGELAPWCTP